MVAKLYELTPMRDGSALRRQGTSTIVLDLEQPAAADHAVTGRLMAAADRAGATLSTMHHYAMRVQEMDAEGRTRGPVLRWELPLAVPPGAGSAARTV